ncbi:MAG: RICIN domain-containing protein [Coriobacteriales bacterium]|jgi:uncharacterized protein YvpB|nr:RICIN domain-containing protein [Coriobacteriales bacterium]
MYTAFQKIICCGLALVISLVLVPVSVADAGEGPPDTGVERVVQEDPASPDGGSTVDPGTVGASDGVELPENGGAASSPKVFGEAEDSGETDETSAPHETVVLSGSSEPPSLADGSYYIRPASSLTRMVDVDHASLANGANVQIWNSNKTGAQQFDVEYDSQTGSYLITNVNSQAALDVTGGQAYRGANIQQYQRNETDAQRWQLVPDTARSGAYKLVSVLSLQAQGAQDTTELVADVAAAQDANATNLRLWTANGTAAQSFYFLSTSYAHPSAQTVEDGSYTIRSSLNYGLVLDLPGASDAPSTQIQLYPSNGTLAQIYYVKWDEGTQYYTISSLASGQVLDCRGGGIVSRTALQQYVPNGTPAQQWALVRNEDGTVTFFAARSALVIDVPGANAAARTGMQLYVSNGTPAQSFVLEPVDLSIPQGVVALSPKYDASLRVDIPGASDAAGLGVKLHPSNGTFAQKFELIATGGHYALRAVNSGRYLQDAGAAAGNRVVQGSMGPSLPDDAGRAGGVVLSELWNILPAIGGYLIENVASGYYLMPAGLDLYTQPVGALAAVDGLLRNAPEAALFRIAWTNLSPPEDYYTVYTRGNNAFDVVGASYISFAAIQLHQANGTGAQTFRVQTGSDGFFNLTNIYNKKAVGMADSRDLPGTLLQQSPDNGSYAQRFILETTGEGWFYIKTPAGYYISARSDSSGTRLYVGTKDSALTFRFGLVGYSLPWSVFIDTPYESQTAIRAWNGCESASAAMLLRSQNIATNTADFIARVPITGNPYTGYSGSPYLSGGLIELFPSGIMGPMSSYGVTPVDLTYASWNTIQEYLASRRPVVVWANWEGKGAHVCCVYGYTNDRVFYHDPYYGPSKSVSISEFLSQWAWYGYRAVSVN